MSDPYSLVRNGSLLGSFSERTSSPPSTSILSPVNSIHEPLASSSSLFLPPSTSVASNSANDATLTSILGNILAMSMQDDIKDPSNRSCTCNEGIKADSYCHDCKEHLCARCVSAHYRVTLTKDHVIVKCDNSLLSESHSRTLPYLLPPPVNNQKTFCNVHSNQVYQFFCENCSKAICTQCTMFEHNGHNFQYLQSVAESSKTVSSTLLAEARDNYQALEKSIVNIQQMAERVVARSKVVKSEIHATVQKHMMALEQRERDLVGKVDQIRQVKCQILSSQLTSLQQSANLLKTSMEDSKNAFHSNSDLEIIKAKERLQSLVAASTSLTSSALPHEDDRMLFAPPDLPLFHAIAGMGDVKSSACAPQSLLSREGPASHTALCGSNAAFIIHARDHSGTVKQTGGDMFEVLVKRPDNTTYRVKTNDSGDGRYHFHVQFVAEGQYVISAQFNGVPVCESPYVVRVKPGVNYATRASAGSPSLVFGKEGDKNGELCRPWGICCDAQGRFIVADRSNNRIQVFRPDGTFHHKFGTHGQRHGQFDRPAGVAIDNHGNIIVADKDNHRIQILSLEGTFIRAFGERGSKSGQFNYPWDVAVLCKQQQQVIAVSDTRNHRVQIFNYDGVFLAKYGFEGSMWKHFDSPRGCVFSPEGRLIVTDFNNHRLVIIEPDMTSARYLGSEGSQALQFLRPQGVTIDEEGNIIVADSRNHRLQVFTPSGGLLAVFGGQISPFQMDRPSGVAVTPQGRIAVVDFGNNRVVVL